PPDRIVHDAGLNFNSKELRQHAGIFSILVKEVPVESHKSVVKIERYHVPLKRAYEIIKDELKNELQNEPITKDMILQMPLKL
ncbi:hypothetical protein PSTG_20104, partial [Puccinia striiformis f. sp. tritici PST-78]